MHNIQIIYYSNIKLHNLKAVYLLMYLLIYLFTILCFKVYKMIANNVKNIQALSGEALYCMLTCPCMLHKNI